MQFFRQRAHNPLVRHAMIAFTAGLLSPVLATAALAAGRGVAAGAGRARGGSGGSIIETVPSTPPTFNPSYRYTVPEAPETPVSPASPGSVFGNG